MARVSGPTIRAGKHSLGPGIEDRWACRDRFCRVSPWIQSTLESLLTFTICDFTEEGL